MINLHVAKQKTAIPEIYSFPTQGKKKEKKKFNEPSWRSLYTQNTKTALLLETTYFTLYWFLIIGKNVKFVRETESFPFKLSHKISSWVHCSYGTRLFQRTFLLGY